LKIGAFVFWAEEASLKMQVKRLQPADEVRWEKYVLRHPQGHMFHSLKWRNAVWRTFGHEPYYLWLEDEGRVRGILPLFFVRSWLFGRQLVSVPFGVYGGILADSEAAGQRLVEAAGGLAAELAVDFVEFRYLEPGPVELPTKDLYMTFILDLPADAEIVWKTMRKRNRNILRKGIKSGLTLFREPEPGNIQEDEFLAFYELFAGCQRALGTPVLPKDFFRELQAEFGKGVALFSATYQGKIVSSLWVFFYKDVVSPYYIGYDPAYLQFAPNNWILWEVIKYACEHGYKQYDMGRSRKNTGSFRFKIHWGIEPRPLYYQYILHKSQKIPQVNPSNPKYELPRKIWSRLPLPLTKLLGPHLVKYLG